MLFLTMNNLPIHLWPESIVQLSSYMEAIFSRVDLI